MHISIHFYTVDILGPNNGEYSTIFTCMGSDTFMIQKYTASDCSSEADLSWSTTITSSDSEYWEFSCGGSDCVISYTSKTYEEFTECKNSPGVYRDYYFIPGHCYNNSDYPNTNNGILGYQKGCDDTMFYDQLYVNDVCDSQGFADQEQFISEECSTASIPQFYASRYTLNECQQATTTDAGCTTMRLIANLCVIALLCFLR